MSAGDEKAQKKGWERGGSEAGLLTWGRKGEKVVELGCFYTRMNCGCSLSLELKFCHRVVTKFMMAVYLR